MTTHTIWYILGAIVLFCLGMLSYLITVKQWSFNMCIRESIRELIRKEMKTEYDKTVPDIIKKHEIQKQYFAVGEVLKAFDNTKELLTHAEKEIQNIIENVESITGCDVDSISWSTRTFSDKDKSIRIKIEAGKDDEC